MKQLILLILLVPLISSCSPSEPLGKEGAKITIEATKEVETNKEIFSFNKNSNSINLSLNSTPVASNIGYIRLAGILSSEKLAALIEVAGKGNIVNCGDKLAEYRVKKISDKGVLLCLEK
ncbi:hypothetical protein HZC34_03355 [Candidatus Saganbacteria bacterium]|nr:hypothetical protein [Candidatus Saganbacteria bacterium]